MNDSYISYGSDGSYHIISPIGEGFDIETDLLIALVIIAIYVMWHYSATKKSILVTTLIGK